MTYRGARGVALAAQHELFENSLRPAVASRGPGIERVFSVPFVAELALKEKQIQQNVRPIIAVHKWFARRPGTLFRALLLSEFASPPLRDAFYQPHQLRGVRIADPFMGGGTPLLEANRLGCDVFGWDVNPMAYWVVRQEIEHLDLALYAATAERIGAGLRKDLEDLFATTCTQCGSIEASAKYFVWVKVVECQHCRKDVLLLPGYVLAHAGRHPQNVLLCQACGSLTEAEDLSQPGDCRDCGRQLSIEGNARRGACTCHHCGAETRYPDREKGPPEHRMVGIEYHCEACKKDHVGRFFKKPDVDDRERYARAERSLARIKSRVIPDDRILEGDETARLHRWGYHRYREMFNARQLLALEKLGRRILAVEDERIRNALATNFSDLLRYQNMACRYDTRALKSLDVFSVHGFPVGLVQCESNFLGLQRPGTRTNIGSGGWSNIVEKFSRAKEYCEAPFEIRYTGNRKTVVPVNGEWIGDRRNGRHESRTVALHAASSTEAELPPGSLDAVLTDPPYFANVQYAELMDFCYVWLRRLVPDEPAFRCHTTRNSNELTGNVTLNRCLEHFAEGLATVYRRMAQALVPGAPFVFTYHHNALDAYIPIGVAILDAGLVCTSSLPCPAEMGGSIHIHGTESSIVDTVFVCRSTGSVLRRELAQTAADISRLVLRDVGLLRESGVRVTLGDARCVAYGHLVRMAVWRLRSRWDRLLPAAEKLGRLRVELQAIGDWDGVAEHLSDADLHSRRGETVSELVVDYGEGADDEVPF